MLLFRGNENKVFHFFGLIEISPKLVGWVRFPVGSIQRLGKPYWWTYYVICDLSSLMFGVDG